jgi:hypothetical protein
MVTQSVGKLLKACAQWVAYSDETFKQIQLIAETKNYHLKVLDAQQLENIM